MRFDLSDEHQEKAEEFWQEMLKLKPGSSRTNRDLEQRHIQEVGGKLGECVCSIPLNLPVDWTVKPWTADDNGIDFTFRGGQTLDAKAVQVHTTMDFDYHILVDPSKLKSDLFCLVLIAPDQTYGDIAGGISRARFQQVARRKSDMKHRGDFEPMAVNRGMLRSFNHILELAGRPCVMPDVTEFNWG